MMETLEVKNTTTASDIILLTLAQLNVPEGPLRDARMYVLWELTRSGVIKLQGKSLWSRRAVSH